MSVGSGSRRHTAAPRDSGPGSERLQTAVHAAVAEADRLGLPEYGRFRPQHRYLASPVRHL